MTDNLFVKNCSICKQNFNTMKKFGRVCLALSEKTKRKEVQNLSKRHRFSIFILQ